MLPKRQIISPEGTGPFPERAPERPDLKVFGRVEAALSVLLCMSIAGIASSSTALDLLPACRGTPAWCMLAVSHENSFASPHSLRDLHMPIVRVNLCRGALLPLLFLILVCQRRRDWQVSAAQLPDPCVAVVLAPTSAPSPPLFPITSPPLPRLPPSLARSLSQSVSQSASQ